MAFFTSRLLALACLIMLFSSVASQRNPLASWNIQVVKVESPYGCPAGYYFIPYQYLNLVKRSVCNALGQYDVARIAGGGSQDGPGYNCRNRQIDGRNLGNSVCAQWTVQNIQESQRASCPRGTARISYNDALNNQAQVCSALGEYDIAAVGAYGSFDGSGYDCKIRDWDTRSLGNAVCVTINLTNVQETTFDTDSICGSTQSLVNVREAKAHQKAICALLDQYGIYRLAGGGSMDGPGYGCHIRDTDTRTLGSAICARAAQTR